jgi:hypothetical protein
MLVLAAVALMSELVMRCSERAATRSQQRA